MTKSFRASPFALAALALVGALGAAAEAGEAEARQGTWRACLSRNFGVHAGLTGRDLAADAAFRTCRYAEEAYLSALSASPLLDADDIAQARSALADRARAWLIGSDG